MINFQNLLAIQPNADKGHVSLLKPETADLLVLTHKVCSLNPERELFGGMAINPDDRIIFRVNPYLAFEEILVSPFRNRLRDEAVVRSHQLLTEQVQSVVCRRDGAIVMLLTRRRFDLTGA